MKKFHISIRNSAFKQRGFALIATITLMILLALLAVGLLSIAATQTRLSEKGLYAGDAKAQAKLALEMAIGRLQSELGPDQRVSANSSILDSSPATATIDGVNSPNILGVWNSWDSWLNRQNSRGQNITNTYNTGRNQLFRSWLISTARLQEAVNADSPIKGTLGTERTNQVKKVQLLGRGSLGDDKAVNNRIFADLIQIDDSIDVNDRTTSKKNAQIRKSIAWWITGENQKVRINLPRYASDKATDKIEVLRRTWDTPPPDNTSIEAIRSLAGSLPSTDSADYDRIVRQLISRGTLNLAAGQRAADDIGQAYHDISLYSSGLQADVKFGGLKKDINILASQSELPSEFRKTDSDVGFRPYGTDDGSPSVTNRPIGSWPQLYYWANMWDSQNVREGQDTTAGLHWNGNSPYTLIASDSEAVTGMMNNKYTYMRHLIPIKYYSFVGIRVFNTGSNLGGASNRGALHFGIGIIPVIVYWNPYNVDMKLEGASGELWGTYSGQYRMMPLLAASNIRRWELGRPTMTNDDLLDTKTEAGVTGFNKTANKGSYDYAKPKRQLADYGSTLRKDVSLVWEGKVTKGDQSSLGAGEIIIFAYPEGVPGSKGSPFGGGANTVSVENLKAYMYDFDVDGVPLKEGWSQNELQTGQYSTRSDGSMEYIMFSGLTGSEFPEDEKYKISISFAEKLNDMNLTPDEFVLSTKLTDEMKNGNLGAFVYANGLMDTSKIGKRQDNKPKSEGGSSDIDIYSKMAPNIFNINWGAWEKPLVEKAYIPQELWDNSAVEAYSGYPDDAARRNALRKGAYFPKGSSASATITGRPTDGHLSFIAYFGVSAKWNASPLIGTYPDGRDYRAKIWQHSSPLFWGNQMVNASELARTYSPYQLEVKFANDEFAPITINNVLSNDGTRNSVFGGPNGVQVSKIVAAELPLHPPYSLAGFAGMRLTPGWYDGGNNRAEVAKRFAYQSGVPGVGIGNSFADPMLPAGQVFSHNEISNDPALGDFWDHALMINDGLWDSWFASSLSSRPSGIGDSGSETLESVISEAVKVTDGNSSTEKAPLSNRRFTLQFNGKDGQDIVSELTGEEGYKKASQFIKVDGAFNVNSTSLVAWKAILAGLKNRNILYMDSGIPDILASDSNSAYFSRFAVASNKNSHVDDLGATGVTNGLLDNNNQAWSDLRKIDGTQIDTLAEKMVEQVKKRGPFLNMSEFINRRLQTGELGLKGALQAAIDESGMNSVFEQISEDYVNPAASYPNQEAGKGSYYTAAPGYLIQSDVLAVLGNILTVRDDTFTIRAYGEIADKSGNDILARAWCEAVVQRQIDYVDPSNLPETPATSVNYSSGALEDGGLSDVNKAFGRKLTITSFRWLSSDEI